MFGEQSQQNSNVAELRRPWIYELLIAFNEPSKGVLNRLESEAMLVCYVPLRLQEVVIGRHCSHPVNTLLGTSVVSTGSGRNLPARFDLSNSDQPLCICWHASRISASLGR